MYKLKDLNVGKKAPKKTCSTRVSSRSYDQLELSKVKRIYFCSDTCCSSVDKFPSSFFLHFSRRKRERF